MLSFTATLVDLRSLLKVVPFAHDLNGSQLSEEDAGLSRSHGETVAGFPTTVSCEL